VRQNLAKKGYQFRAHFDRELCFIRIHTAISFKQISWMAALRKEPSLKLSSGMLLRPFGSSPASFWGYR
jgi:hypothetical protein